MRKALRVIAAIMLLGSVLFWAVAGANRGWTKTSVPHTNLDPVTGIEGISYESKFVPGLDFLACAGAASLLPAGMSFVVGRRKSRGATAESSSQTP